MYDGMYISAPCGEFTFLRNATTQTRERNEPKPAKAIVKESAGRQLLLGTELANQSDLQCSPAALLCQVLMDGGLWRAC
jgi:hypothetical protein